MNWKNRLKKKRQQKEQPVATVHKLMPPKTSKKFCFKNKIKQKHEKAQVETNEPIPENPEEEDSFVEEIEKKQKSKKQIVLHLILSKIILIQQDECDDIGFYPQDDVEGQENLPMITLSCKAGTGLDIIEQLGFDEENVQVIRSI